MSKPLHGNATTISSPRLSGYLLLIALTFFWGFAWPVFKIALSEIGPWTFRTVALVLGGVGIMALAKAKGLKISVPKGELRPLLLVSLLNVTGWHLCSAQGIIRMNAGRAVIIGYTMALWASFFATFILKEKLTGRRVLALALGMTGLLMLILSDLKAILAAPLGILFMLVAAVSWGAGTVFMKYFKWTMPVVLLTGWQILIGSIPVIAGTFLLENIAALGQISWKATLAMVYVIFFPMLFCHWAWFSIVSIFPAGVAAIGTLAIPVVGVVSSAIVLSESMGLQELSALVVIVTALGIALLGGTKPSEPEARPLSKLT